MSDTITILSDKKKIPILIDAAYAEAVGRYHWYVSSRGYPHTGIGKRPKRKVIALHAFLFGRAPDGLEWDHINRNKLDNRRANLRAVARVVNARNLPAFRPGHVNGVRIAPGKTLRWWAFIGYNKGTKKYLGTFATREEAIEARQRAEVELWGKA